MLELNEHNLIVLDEEGKKKRNEKDKENDEEVHDEPEPEDEDYEKKEIAYDEPVSEAEIGELREEIGDRAEKKALEIGATRKEILEGTEIDLESLEGAELGRGDFEFIKNNLDKSVDRVWRSKITRNEFFPEALPGRVVGPDRLSRVDQLLDFAHKHIKAVNLFQLAIYCSSFGSAVFKDLAGNKAILEVGDHKISLQEIANDPDLMKKISKEGNLMTPLDLSHIYFHGSENQADANDSEDSANVSVVAFEDFKINQNLDVGEVHNKEKELCEEYQVFDNEGKVNEENWQKAKPELEEWSKSKGYDSFDTAIAAESENSPAAKFQHLKDYEMDIANSEHFPEFSEAFLKALGKYYSWPEFVEICKENPNQALTILAEVQVAETDYDYVNAVTKLIMESAEKIPGPIGEHAGEKWDKTLEERYPEGVAASTFKNGKAICWETATANVWAKVAVEQAGAPLGGVACVCTKSLDGKHTWTALATTSPDGKRLIVSSGDATLFEHHIWEGSKEEAVNAVDDWHYYGTDESDQDTPVQVDRIDASGYHYLNNVDSSGQSPYEINEITKRAHWMTLENIKRHNVLNLQEKLKQDLSMYDPDSYKKNHRIQMDEESYREMKKYETAEKERTDNEARQQGEAESLLKKNQRENLR